MLFWIRGPAVALPAGPSPPAFAARMRYQKKEPGDEVSALLGPLARRAREAIRREPDPSLAEQLELEFGYAVFPEDAQTARGVQLLAAKPRVSIERD